MSEALFQQALRHHGAGRVAQAAELYDRLLRQLPGHAAVLPMAAMAAWQLGEIDRAGQAWQQVLAKTPALPEAHVGLGLVYEHRGDLAMAAACFERAAQLNPQAVDAHFNLGNVLRRQGQFELALASFRRVLAIDPRHAPALANSGAARLALGDAADAEIWLRKALAVDPALAEAWSILGEILSALRRPDEAVAALARAIDINPNRAETRFNFGNALRDIGDYGAAINQFQAILAQTGLAAELMQSTRDNLALTLLKSGRLAEGWAQYAGRASARQRRFGPPRWNGAPPDGKLLVWGEQGVGDEILYAGMVPDLLARGLDLVIECEPRLAPLFRRSFAGVEVVERRQPHPDPRLTANDIAAQIAMPDLGAILRPDFAAFPARQSYLAADPGRVADLRAAYGAADGRRLVGISWASAATATGAGKSTRLSDWSAILSVPGIRFVDLQYGPHPADLAAAKAAGIDIVQDASIDPLRDLDAFAAQVAAMDRVVSVSNSAVHVAGALGVPVWTLIPRGAGQLWYWFDGRDESPFYPSMRLIRQARQGDWGPVLETVAVELRKVLA